MTASDSTGNGWSTKDIVLRIEKKLDQLTMQVNSIQEGADKTRRDFDDYVRDHKSQDDLWKTLVPYGVESLSPAMLKDYAMKLVVGQVQETKKSTVRLDWGAWYIKVAVLAATLAIIQSTLNIHLIDAAKALFKLLGS